MPRMISLRSDVSVDMSRRVEVSAAGTVPALPIETCGPEIPLAVDPVPDSIRFPADGSSGRRFHRPWMSTCPKVD